MSRRKRRIGDEDERRSRNHSPKQKRSRTNKENQEQLQSKGAARKSWEQYSEDESSRDQAYSECRSKQHGGRHSKSESNRDQESRSESRSKENLERRSEWDSRRNLESHSESSEIKQQPCSESERNRNWESYLQDKMKRVQDTCSKSERNDGHAGDIPLSEKKMDSVNLRSGGAYIPPAKLKMLQEKITDKGSIEYQRIAWEALKKSLTGLTNKVSVSNIHEVVREIFRENVIRGRGVLARAIIQAQAMSPTFTPIYAALVAVINSKFPQIGELILKRLIIQFKRSFRRNDRQVCVPAVQFIGHLLNQEVAHEVLGLEILTLLLESATDDAVELAIALLKNCGMKLTELSSRGITAIFESIRHLNYGPALSKRVKYMIDVIYAIRKDNFKDYVSVPEGLDLVDEDDKFTHLLTLEDAKDPEDILNVFKFDPDYIANEEKYKEIQRELLGESESEASDSASDSESDEEEEEEEKAEENQKIHDLTETNLVALRRNIYLTIQSSLDFEECAHKLLKLELNPGQIVEMCYMILDCCAQQRTYEKFYGLLAQRFCQLNKVYVEPFTDIFKVSYETIHRFETNKLRNVAKFFAHLLYTDAISWTVLSCIKLNEDDTTSSNRIFIKILFQELCEYMGLKKLNDRVKDVTLQEAFDGLFPRDNPRNTRFAINFFTSIGLGGLTDELREHLKSAPKAVPPASASLTVAEESMSSSSTSSSSSDSEESEQSDEPKQKEKTRKKTVAPKKNSKKKNEKKHKKSSKLKKKKKR